ncbi:ATP-binding protein, partial [Escherichia coli]|nr:ATP-binding protein [Escherichia coli]
MNQLASTIDFQEYEEDLSFSVDGRLLSELGEKLVTKNSLALSELIKNGYDADSSLVEISLHNVRQINKSSTIIIR